MALTKFDIISRAMVGLDADKVESFSGEDTKEKNVSAVLYDGIRDSELSNYPWNFNQVTTELAQQVGEPAEDWAYQYSLPSDWLRTVNVTDASDNNIPWQEAGGRILADSDRVKLTYQARVSEAFMTTPFVDALVARCKAEFAEAITGEGNVIDRAWREYELKVRQARRIDAQSNPPGQLISPSNSTWLAARHGS